jgi:hypothetical protein
MENTVLRWCVAILEIVGVYTLLFGLVGCGGRWQNNQLLVEEQVPHSRTFTIVDEHKTKVGSIIIQSFGRAVLCDENGRVIGRYMAQEPSAIEPNAGRKVDDLGD